MMLSFHRLINKTKANQHSSRVFKARTGIARGDHRITKENTPTDNENELMKRLEAKQLKMFESFKKEFINELKSHC